MSKIGNFSGEGRSNNNAEAHCLFYQTECFLSLNRNTIFTYYTAYSSGSQPLYIEAGETAYDCALLYHSQKYLTLNFIYHTLLYCS